MKKLAIMVVIAAPALAQGLGEKTGVNALLGKPPRAEDFVKIAASTDMFEIKSSKLAEQRVDEASRKFAAQMVADHTSTELKALAAKAYSDLPTALDSSHQSKLDKLQALIGADFNKEYDFIQVDAHENAVFATRMGRR